MKYYYTPSMQKRSLLFFTICLLSAVIVSCSSNSTGSSNYDDDPDNGGGNEQPANEVNMVGMSFTPSTLEVVVGTEVTWTNQSSLVHTVTSGTPDNQDGMFDSGNVSPGETFSYTFTDVGTYEYFCIPHEPNMTGTITVVAN